MDFLLECIGFPPDYDLAALVERVLRDGEPAPWRGAADRHMRLPLGGGLELRMDKGERDERWSLVPHFQVPHRLRVAVEWVRAVPDSPFDALLHGWAAPPTRPGSDEPQPGAYRLSAFLSDARRLPRELVRGQVLALSIAGFALDVTYMGPDAGVCDARILELPHGARIAPLGGPDDPGGCADVSLRIREVVHLLNPVTSIPVEVLVANAPGRPLQVFVSRWQLEREGLPQPRPGWRVEGTFVFSGRIAGGVPGPKRGAGAAFG